VVGTAVSKVCHLEIARTGLRERDAARAGFQYVTVTVQSGTKATYFPGTQQMTVKMTAERLTGRLLGVQIVGNQASAKRIDTAATALWNRMTVEDMTALDPRLRSAARAGLGPDPRGGAAGRRRRAPRGRRLAMTPATPTIGPAAAQCGQRHSHRIIDGLVDLPEGPEHGHALRTGQLPRMPQHRPGQLVQPGRRASSPPAAGQTTRGRACHDRARAGPPR
jgi:hypothetical protein